jgi:hypothetical protein
MKRKIMLKDFLLRLYSDLKRSDTFSFDEKEKNGRFSLREDVDVLLQEMEKGLYFHANICLCPQQKKEDLFLYLMRANLLGRGTGGASIGLDAQEKFLTLSRSLAYEVNYMEFKEKLEDFVNYLLYWREEMEKFEKQASATLY